MSTSEALQRVETRAIDTPISYNAQQLQLIKDTYAKGASDQEFQLFVEVAKHRRLDILKGHMCLIKFKDKSLGREVFQPVVKIDGYRALAESTGLYEGQDGPYWCGKDGVWKDAWLETAPPAAARVGVYRKGFRTPMYAVARFDSYAQRWPDGNLKGQWGAMGDLMLAKCAEGLALRKAFPDMLGGLYTDDEMGQAQTIDITPEPVVVAPAAARDPHPKNLGDLVTPKQLWMIRGMGRELGCDVEQECESLFQAKLEEISKRAASEFIDHLKGLGAVGPASATDQPAPVQTPAPAATPAQPTPSVNSAPSVEYVSAETLAAIEKLWADYGAKDRASKKVVVLNDWLYDNHKLSHPTLMPKESAVKLLGWLQDKALKLAEPAPAEKPKADRGAGLDEWQCSLETKSRVLALQILQATTRLEKSGVSETEWRASLNDIPGYDLPVSRKALTAEDADGWLKSITRWAEKNEKAKGATA